MFMSRFSPIERCRLLNPFIVRGNGSFSCASLRHSCSNSSTQPPPAIALESKLQADVLPALPPRTVEFRPCRAPRSYGDENGSLHEGVQRLWCAGWQGADGGLGTANESPSMTLKRGDWPAKSTFDRN